MGKPTGFLDLQRKTASKKKPLEIVALGDLGIEAGPRIEETTYAPPVGRQKGIMVDDVAGLVAALKDKGLV